MLQEQVVHWILCFYIYCFLGWIWETCYVSVRKKKFVNRGFMKGPMLPIYGSGAVCVLLASQPFRGNYALMVLAGMVMATVLEYITGAVMEAMFRVRYWDYSNDFLNLNGYVCLKSTLCWGAMTLLVVYWVHPPIMAFVEGLPEKVVKMLDSVITILAVADFSTSFKDAWDFRILLTRAEKLREEIGNIQARLEDMESRLKERTREVLMEETTRTREALQAELQQLSARRLALQESLKSGYYRGINGILKRNPGVSWKRHPEMIEDIRRLFREARNEKKEK